MFKPCVKNDRYIFVFFEEIIGRYFGDGENESLYLGWVEGHQSIFVSGVEEIVSG